MRAGSALALPIPAALLRGCERAPPLALPVPAALLRGCERAPPLALPAGRASRPPDPLHLMSVAQSTHWHMLMVCQSLRVIGCERAPPLALPAGRASRP